MVDNFFDLFVDYFFYNQQRTKNCALRFINRTSVNYCSLGQVQQNDLVHRFSET